MSHAYEVGFSLGMQKVATSAEEEASLGSLGATQADKDIGAESAAAAKAEGSIGNRAKKLAKGVGQKVVNMAAATGEAFGNAAGKVSWTPKSVLEFIAKYKKGVGGAALGLGAAGAGLAGYGAYRALKGDNAKAASVRAAK